MPADMNAFSIEQWLIAFLIVLVILGARKLRRPKGKVEPVASS